MKRVRVLCSYIVEVEMSDEDYARRHFDIEDNGCPGTGVIGAILYKALEQSEEDGFCWACKLSGQNRIIQDEETTCRHVEMKS